jgi:hypothetical protein
MECPWPVVAAIDFGTHGTGYAWIEVIPANRDASQRKPNFRDRWSGSNRHYPKNLSALLLGPSGEVVEWGHDAEREWHELSTTGRHHGYTYVSDFKMALKPDSYRGMTPPGVGARTINSPADAFPLVVEYLRRMYAVALEEILKSGYLEDQIRWCVTIPAIWDDQEKQLMRDAAEAAGMPKDPDRLLLAIEPEVAALHCQIHLARVLGSQDDRLDITADGRRFMVVDCGGGTVDITSYRVDRGGGDKPRLVQIARATGGKLGSEYINQAFIDQVLESRFGGPDVIARIREECPHALGELVNAWESYKVTAQARLGPNAEPIFDRPVYLVIPGEIRDMLDDDVRERLSTLTSGSANRLAVLPDECRALFDSVAVNIVELVEEQLAEIQAKDGPPAGPERLLMVGGLSGSSYLQLRLQQHFAGKSTLMVPTEPAGAVLFGAVHYGYDPSMIRSRLARYTYGSGMVVAFRPSVDPPEKRILDHEGRALCVDRFAIFIRNRDAVEVSDTVSHTFTPVYPDQAEMDFEFHRTVTRDPGYIDDPQSEAIGTLRIELGDAMNLPLDSRAVRVMFRFGNTEIDVEAVNVHTGQQMHCSLRFDSAY